MLYCETDLSVLDNERLCQWPKGYAITWNVINAVAPFTIDETVDIFHLAWSGVRAECGVESVRINDDRPNIRLHSTRIDGRGGVLGRAQLPCGNVGPTSSLWIQIDSHEQWILSDRLGSEMDLLRVLMHELIHSLGLGHADERMFPYNLMNPNVSNIRYPQPTWDIPELRRRYGPPSDTPDPPPEPTPPEPVDECAETCQKIITDLSGSEATLGGSLIADIRRLLQLADTLRGMWPEVQKLLECIESLSPDEFRSEVDRLSNRRSKVRNKKEKKNA